MKTSMETAVELCRLAAKNRVDDLLVWQLAGADLSSCDYDKRTPLHVVSSRLKTCHNNKKNALSSRTYSAYAHIADVALQSFVECL